MGKYITKEEIKQFITIIYKGLKVEFDFELKEYAIKGKESIGFFRVDTIEKDKIYKKFFNVDLSSDESIVINGFKKYIDPVKILETYKIKGILSTEEYIKKNKKEKERTYAELTLSKTIDLPKLMGSEKQVKWAETIRLDVLSKILRLINDINKYFFNDDEYDEFLDFFTNKYKELLLLTDASKWIQIRSDYNVNDKTLYNLYNCILLIMQSNAMFNDDFVKIKRLELD